MPFCTKCGANVTGAFCNQCGTPASGTAPVQQPVAANPYGQPMAPGAPPVARKTSPIVWILVILLGLFVLGGIAIVGMGAYVAHRARQAGFAFDRGRNGGITFQAPGDNGKMARVEIGGSGKLPSWVPVYPGSDNVSTFAIRANSNNGEEGGNFTYTTTDDAARVKSFYQDKCKELGMKVNLESTSDEGGMLIATDEDGQRRSLTVVVGGTRGQTTVNVTYGAK